MKVFDRELTTDEIIRFVRDFAAQTRRHKDCHDCLYIDMASELADEVEAERRAAPENKALTLEQLRQMGGEPVWVVFEPEDDGTPIDPCWMLVVAEERRLATEYEWVDWDDQGYHAYARRPEGSNPHA